MIFRDVLRAVAVVAVLAVCAGSSRGQGACSNPAINKAYTAVVLRPAIGSGVSGECNPSLYGSWSSQHELELKVVALANRNGTNGPAHTPVAPVVSVPASYAWYVDPRQNLIDNATKSVLATAGTWDLRNPDGTAVSLIAQGGGNLVAQGGGNLIAQGGGNLAGQRSLQSVGGKKVFIIKK